MEQNYSEMDLLIIEEQQELPEWMLIESDYEDYEPSDDARTELIFE